VIHIFIFSIENGLSDETAADRLIRDGPNHIQPPKQLSTWTKLLMTIFSGFSPLLWIAAILAFISWQPLGPEFTYYYSLIIGVVLVVVIILSNLFNFVQERRVMHILSELTIRDQNPTCTVVRSGVHKTINVSQLVIGDIVILETDLRVPADLRIVTCDELKVDTSLLTGEVVPLK
jgi:sodium/potassium-transporting ATPase subunit alpha